MVENGVHRLAGGVYIHRMSKNLARTWSGKMYHTPLGTWKTKFQHILQLPPQNCSIFQWHILFVLASCLCAYDPYHGMPDVIDIANWNLLSVDYSALLASTRGLILERLLHSWILITGARFSCVVFVLWMWMDSVGVLLSPRNFCRRWRLPLTVITKLDPGRSCHFVVWCTDSSRFDVSVC